MTQEAQVQDQEETEAAARGYNRVSGDDPEPPREEPKVELEAPATPEAPKTDEPAAAPAAAPEAPKAEDLTEKVIQGVLDKITPHLTKQINALDGRLGGMKREFTEAIATAKQTAAATGTEAPSDKQLAAAAADPEKWKQLKEDFPQFAEGIEEYVAARVATTKPQPSQPAVDTEELRSRIVQELTPQFEKQLGQTRDQAMKEARAYARIDLEVGDGWEATLQTKEFGAWFDKLPAEKQKQYDSFNAPDVIACLKEFGTHQEAAKTRQAKTERLAAATQVPSTGAGGPPVLTDDDAAARGYARVARR